MPGGPSLGAMATRFNTARAAALALPGAEERPHHDIISFRVAGRIFATAPDEGHLRAMLDEDRIRALTADDPDAFRPLTWGSRLACVAVDLARVDPAWAGDLLVGAWRRKTPAAIASMLELRD